MKNRIVPLLFTLILILAPVVAQKPDKAALAKGVNYIETKVYSAEEDEKILELYKNLRVADVSDGLDMVGLPGTGLVNPDIHACWVDLKEFKHVFRGIAVTVRYVPTQKLPQPAPGEDWMKWEGNFYSAYSHESFAQILRRGISSCH